MNLKMTSQEKDIIEICKVRHGSGKSCRKCIYNGKCAAFYSHVTEEYYMLKEIINIWKNQQFTEQ